MMVCPDKKPEGKLHVYYDGKDMGEVEPYIETDEDVWNRNLLYSQWLLTPRKVSFGVGLFKRLELIRGFYAVRPLMR